MKYIAIRNWDRYQHYKNRRPVWIKYYVELLDEPEIRRLPISTRLLWDQLLLLAARHENRIVNDSEEIAKDTRIDPELVANGLSTLLKGRWIKETSSPRRASKTLATCYQDASPHARPRAREEVEVEVESTSPKGRGSTRPPTANSLPFKHELQLGQLLQAIGDAADNGTPQVIRKYATHLPEGAIAKVTESVKTAPARDRAKYAIGALKSECQERGITA